MPRRHSATNAAYLRRRRATLRKKGLCVHCKRPAGRSTRNPEKPASVCPDCRLKVNPGKRQRAAKLRAIWIKLGLCCSCGQRSSIKATCGGTETRCAVCVEQQSQTKTNRRVLRRDTLEWSAHVDTRPQEH